MAVVAVIGAGGIGSRHLQALALLDQPARVYAVDPSPQSLATAQARWNEVPTASRHEFHALASPADLPDTIDVAVVATTAPVRLRATQGLLSRARPRHVILEKFLFQNDAEYDQAAALLGNAGVRGWVNCPRRVWPAWIDAKRRFADSGPVSCRLTASKSNPLASNAIHWLDLIAWLRPQQRFELDASRLTLLQGDSRHAGQVEFGGTLLGLADGATFEYTRYPTHAAPMLAEVFSPAARLIVREFEQRAWFSCERDNWAWHDIAFPLAYQSRLTHLVVQDLLERDACDLAPYAESAALHRDMLAAFLDCYRRHADAAALACPIT